MPDKMSAKLSARGGMSATMSNGGGGGGGQPGPPGFSPIANVTKSGDTATITITDKTGTTTAQVKDGTNGQPGEDGYSPSASVSKSGTTATISITDKNGTTTAQISDGTPGTPGSPGNDGDDGITPDVTVTSITGGHNIAFDYGTGDSRNTDFDVMDGVKGDTGEAGDSGVYIGTTAPSDPDVNVWIDTSGEGDVITVSGINPVINGVSDTTYICGEVSTITINPPASGGIIDVIFTSGSTVAVLNLPQTVKMPYWFEVEANKTYEINIFHNLGVVMAWT